MLEKRFENLMEREKFDGIVALSPVNVLYLSGVILDTQKLIPDRLAIVVWPATSAPALIICSIEETLTRAQSRIEDIRTYVEFKESPIEVLAKVIKEKHLDKARIGIEKRYIHVEYFEEIRSALPDVCFVGCDRELDIVRSVKSADELALLRRAAMATDKAIAQGFGESHVGCDERFIADRMRDAMYKNGAEEMTFLCMGGGNHSIESHHHACDLKLKLGDVLRVDIGGCFKGYFSDMARTAVMGRPGNSEAAAYQAVWDVMEAVIDAVKPGIEARELYLIYKNQFTARGLDIRMSHVGHSLGIKLHELPILTPFEKQILEPDMVFQIELVNVTGGNLYHNEDQVVVTTKGHEVVSRSRDWSRLFQIT